MKLSLAAFASLYNASAALIFSRATLKESETRGVLSPSVSTNEREGMQRARES